MTKTDGVAAATAGNDLTYTITVTNNGPSCVTGAEFADTFNPSFFDVASVA